MYGAMDSNAESPSASFKPPSTSCPVAVKQVERVGKSGPNASAIGALGETPRTSRIGVESPVSWAHACDGCLSRTKPGPENDASAAAVGS